MPKAKPFYTSRTFWLLLSAIVTPLIARSIGPSADKNAIQDLVVQFGETVAPLILTAAGIYTRAKTPGAPLTLTQKGADAKSDGESNG